MSFKATMRDLFSQIKWHYETKRTRLVWGWRLGYLGHGSIIERNVRITGSRRVKIGSNTKLSFGCSVLTASDKDYVTIGDSSHISRSACLDAAGGFIEIGNFVYVGAYSVIGGHGGCKIGNDCQIAAFCYIIATNHIFDNPSIPIRLQGNESRGVEIHEDCWLGNGVSVLDGVMVGHGCVLAAHCVVTKNTEPYSVMAGVPARLLHKRGDVK
jgi:acetyltransferase-like isoleucine patch superfamily enzyme